MKTVIKKFAYKTLVLTLLSIPALAFAVEPLDVNPPASWSPARQELLHAKLRIFNQTGVIENQCLRPNELSLLLESNASLDPSWIPVKGRSVTQIPGAITPGGTEVYRGIRTTEAVARRIFEQGFESPVMWKYRRDPESVSNQAVVTGVINHVAYSPNSALISTTRDLDVAKGFAQQEWSEDDEPLEGDGYVFLIQLANNQGIDVGTVFEYEGKADYDFMVEHEQEISVPFFLPPESIIAVYKVVDDELVPCFESR